MVKATLQCVFCGVASCEHGNALLDEFVVFPAFLGPQNNKFSRQHPVVSCQIRQQSPCQLIRGVVIDKGRHLHDRFDHSLEHALSLASFLSSLSSKKVMT